MLVVGLGGGIGAGKSTVAELLAARGALVIDADELAHQVIAPGGSAYQQVKARFGTTDRAQLAEKVFADPEELAELEAIVHPAVGRELERLLAAADAEVVVIELPLLGDRSAIGSQVDKTIVVDCPEEVAVRRVAQSRELDTEEAWARVRAQTDRGTRRAAADYVVDNSGDKAALEIAVDELWERLRPSL